MLLSKVRCFVWGVPKIHLMSQQNVSYRYLVCVVLFIVHLNNRLEPIPAFHLPCYCNCLKGLLMAIWGHLGRGKLYINLSILTRLKQKTKTKKSLPSRQPPSALLPPASQGGGWGWLTCSKISLKNHKVRQILMNIPSEKCERLLVFEQILQAHLVVHDGLQAFDAPDLDKKVNQQFSGSLF